MFRWTVGSAETRCLVGRMADVRYLESMFSFDKLKPELRTNGSAQFVKIDWLPADPGNRFGGAVVGGSMSAAASTAPQPKRLPALSKRARASADGRWKRSSPRSVSVSFWVTGGSRCRAGWSAQDSARGWSPHSTPSRWIFWPRPTTATSIWSRSVRIYRALPRGTARCGLWIRRTRNALQPAGPCSPWATRRPVPTRRPVCGLSRSGGGSAPGPHPCPRLFGMSVF